MREHIRCADALMQAQDGYRFELCRLSVTCLSPIASVRVLPSSLKIVPRIHGKQLALTMTDPNCLARMTAVV
jgi:hypothetical protein